MDTDVTVTPDYFAVTGMRVRMGRALRDADRNSGVVISDSLAKRYWPGANPVGMSIQYGDSRRNIVGVVSDARDVSLDSPPVPTLFHAWNDADAPIATMMVRFSGHSGTTIAGIRQAI